LRSLEESFHSSFSGAITIIELVIDFSCEFLFFVQEYLWNPYPSSYFEICQQNYQLDYFFHIVFLIDIPIVPSTTILGMVSKTMI